MKLLLILFAIAGASGIHIDCFYYQENFEVLGELYTCYVYSMDSSVNSTHITGYSGQHLSGYSSADVKGISFNPVPQCELKIVPKGILNVFPNFLAIYIHQCPIETLNGDELAEYQNLQWWGIRLSNITHVPGNLFASNPQMKLVAFVENGIYHVGGGLLDNLHKLEQVLFFNEICIDMFTESPSEIPALIETLKRNCLNFKAGEIRIGCVFFESAGDFGFIDPVYTCEVVSMRFLDEPNIITIYSGQHLSGLSGADVKLIRFSTDYCPQLNLTTMPKGLTNAFPNFIGLSLGLCPIETLNDDDLIGYPNLQMLALAISRVIRIPGNFFASNPHMRSIGFSNNQIKRVGEGLLDNLKDLEEAYFFEPCINQWVSNPSEIPALIEALRHGCPDVV